jgi:catechol 2,3-dioxygenase-like lactoylglutathione lyase family enzyme
LATAFRLRGAQENCTTIAHIGIIVGDIEKNKKFYTTALKPIGYEMIREHGVTPTRHAPSAGFHEQPRADLWLYQGNPGEVPSTSHFKSTNIN